MAVVVYIHDQEWEFGWLGVWWIDATWRGMIMTVIFFLNRQKTLNSFHTFCLWLFVVCADLSERIHKDPIIFDEIYTQNVFILLIFVKFRLMLVSRLTWAQLNEIYLYTAKYRDFWKKWRKRVAYSFKARIYLTYKLAISIIPHKLPRTLKYYRNFMSERQ